MPTARTIARDGRMAARWHWLKRSAQILCCRRWYVHIQAPFNILPLSCPSLSFFADFKRSMPDRCRACATRPSPFSSQPIRSHFTARSQPIHSAGDLVAHVRLRVAVGVGLALVLLVLARDLGLLQVSLQSYRLRNQSFFPMSKVNFQSKQINLKRWSQLLKLNFNFPS